MFLILYPKHLHSLSLKVMLEEVIKREQEKYVLLREGLLEECASS